MSTNTRRQWITIASAAGVILCVALTGAGIASWVDDAKMPNPHSASRRAPDKPGAASLTTTSGLPVQYTKEVSDPGPGLSGPQAAQQALKGMGDSALIEGATVDPGPTGAEISVQLKQNDDEVPQDWAAAMVAGAITELLRTDETVVGEVTASATATGPDYDGNPSSTELGVGAVRLGQVFNSPSDAELNAHLEDVAKEFGLSISGVEIFHPIESALSVTFVVPDDAKVAWTIDQLRTAIVGESPDVEGIFIELDSPEGQALLKSGAAYRIGDGDVWFASGQDDRFGAMHGAPPLAESK